MVKSEYDDGGLGEKLRVFASGFLGDLAQELDTVSKDRPKALVSVKSFAASRRK